MPFDDAAMNVGAGGSTQPPSGDEAPMPGGSGGATTRSSAALPHGVDAGSPSSGAPSSDETCAAEPVTLAEIHEGRVRGKVSITVAPLVISSQKFLVSEAKSGSCLWGTFAADPRRVGAASGLLLVSFGAMHQDGEACRSGQDGLPDDLAPGDVVEARGVLDEFAPAACADVAPAQQLRIDPSCPLRRTGQAAPPEPHVIDATFADSLAQGDDQALLRNWGGALIRLDSVSAVRDSEDGDAVFPFGVVRLAETQLEVHSRLYYFDLTDGGPRAVTKAPHYEYPTSFASVTGLLLLDYCNWVLAPRDPYVDAPSAAAGASQAAGP